jgi:hypothetical protein
LSCFLFVLMCLAHIILLSKCMPRYFTSFYLGLINIAHLQRRTGLVA